MAGEVLTDAHVDLNGVDHSDHVTQVQLSMSVAELDAAAMGDDTMVKEPGLKDFSLRGQLQRRVQLGRLR